MTAYRPPAAPLDPTAADCRDNTSLGRWDVPVCGTVAYATTMPRPRAWAPHPAGAHPSSLHPEPLPGPGNLTVTGSRPRLLEDDAQPAHRAVGDLVKSRRWRAFAAPARAKRALGAHSSPLTEPTAARVVNASDGGAVAGAALCPVRRGAVPPGVTPLRLISAALSGRSAERYPRTTGCPAITPARPWGDVGHGHRRRLAVDP